MNFRTICHTLHFDSYDILHAFYHDIIVKSFKEEKYPDTLHLSAAITRPPPHTSKTGRRGPKSPLSNLTLIPLQINAPFGF